jgi:hypothetical protein
MITPFKYVVAKDSIFSLCFVISFCLDFELQEIIAYLNNILSNHCFQRLKKPTE